ncbi:Mbov_0395 family pilin-like conjugal transfer protein [Patescibacteria group bacterium]
MRNAISKLLVRISVLPVLLLPSTGLAQNPGLDGAKSDLQALAGTGGIQTETELPILIGRLINAFLGVLGIIFVILVIYAGYLYMTASGDDEKVKKAKKLLGQAVIGLVIIVAAYAIATYVIDVIIAAAE